MTSPTIAVRVLRTPRATRTDAFFLVAVAMLVIFALAAIFAPFVAPYDPEAVDLGAVYAAPSPAHWLCTDALGRDILSRLIYGARTALLITTLSFNLLGDSVRDALDPRGERLFRR